MNILRKWSLLVVSLFVFGMAAAGCGNGRDTGLEAVPGEHSGGQAVAGAGTDSGGMEEAEPAETGETKKDLSISSQDEANAGTEGADNGNLKETPAEPGNYNVSEPFDTARPTLMGFTIGDAMEAVITRFGKPLAETAIHDGQLLHVLEYPGFRFGAGEDHKLVFIEVLTDQVMPGLNHFRIGQTVEEAQKALGPADSLNDYVMIYEFGDVVLKCDLNPNNNTVIAIRLFAA